MNIIIVRNAHTVPRRLDLSGRRSRLLAVAALAGCALLFIALGAVSTLLLGDTRGNDLREIAELRASLAAQRDALVGLGEDSHRNLDAFAMQLGKLQAQATRLNALGDRLAEVGKLGDGEFDFSSEPALGGPDERVAGIGGTLPLQANIDELAAELDRQEAQLDVLENLLRDRTIDNALLPSGMPVAQGYIVSGYGSRTDPIDGHAGMHRGIDFDAPYGSDIHAVADGVVTWSGQRSGYGNVVDVDHGNGYMTRYAHNQKNLVKEGERVKAGDVIAKMGSTGRATGSHVHFEVWLNGSVVNPNQYLRNARG